MEGLSRIARSATAIAAEHRAYPESVGLTPEEVPAGESVQDSEGTWDNPTWKALGFRMVRAHHFSFAFESNKTQTGAQFTARAHGDLDGDGIYSTFRVSGEVAGTEKPVIYPIEMDREVE
jgi:hypothetical protein